MQGSKIEMSAAASKVKHLPVTKQFLEALQITKLKNLRDVELDFRDGNLTALMGANGNGKSTVLHALACAFEPLKEDEAGNKFSEFFKPNDDAKWDGSEFDVTYTQGVGPHVQEHQVQKYTKQSDRWSPRYARRPKRSVKYLLIRECVPEVELMTTIGHVHYDKGERASGVDDEIRTAASAILNRKYDKYHSVTYKIAKRKSIGVSSGSLTYSALSMNSGEQRVFRILDAVHQAPKYGLVLIDEIDLFLHEDALKRLINHLQLHCSRNKKQLIFTSHFPPIASMDKDLSVITLHRTPERTVAWNGYSHEALRHMTGINSRPITVYVEDDVSEAIVSRCATQKRVRPYLSILPFGCASNAYSVGAGLLLSGSNLEQSLILTDGDVIRSHKEKRAQTVRVLGGSEPGKETERRRLQKAVRMYHPDGMENPEQALHRMICSLDINFANADDADLIRAAQEVVHSADKHAFLDKVINWLGESREVCLERIARLAATSQGWSRYTNCLDVWLNHQKPNLNILHK